MAKYIFIVSMLFSLSSFAQSDSLLSERKCESLIRKGDLAFAASSMIAAKAAYVDALAIEPGNEYLTNQILKCNLYFTNHCGSPHFDAAIKAGDSLFKAKKYSEAKLRYQEAHGLKASEEYPVRQIVVCDQMIAASERNRIAQTQYDRILVVADSLFKVGDYSNAKLKYFDALQIRPEEMYLKDQIEWCDFKLAGIQYQKEYATAIKTADSAFAGKDFRLAKSWYLTALNLRPSEQYPRWQMGKCDEFLKED